MNKFKKLVFLLLIVCSLISACSYEVDWVRTNYEHKSEAFVFKGEDYPPQQWRIQSNQCSYAVIAKPTNCGKSGLNECAPFSVILYVDSPKPSQYEAITIKSIQVFSLANEELLFESSQLLNVKFDRERYKEYIYIAHRFDQKITLEQAAEEIVIFLKFDLHSGNAISTEHFIHANLIRKTHTGKSKHYWTDGM